MSKLAKLTLFCLIGAPPLLFGANMHLQTSADPITQHMQLNFPKEKIDIYLDNPGVTYRKSPEGHLNYLSFVRLNILYQIWFHPREYPNLVEAPSLIKRFQQYNDSWLLEGATQTLDQAGNIITETYWSGGVFHGSQRIFNKNLQLVEEKEFERGIPVRKWRTYYDDGVLASETTFLEGLAEWEATQVLYEEEDITVNGVLQTMHYYRPVEIQTIWYDQEGQKQQKETHSVNYDGKRLRSLEKTRSAIFN